MLCRWASRNSTTRIYNQMAVQQHLRHHLLATSSHGRPSNDRACDKSVPQCPGSTAQSDPGFAPPNSLLSTGGRESLTCTAAEECALESNIPLSLQAQVKIFRL